MFYGLYIPVKGGSSASAAAGNAAASTGGCGGVGGGASGLTGAAAAGGSGDQNAADSPFVYRSKNEALDVLKMHKDARLREFISEDDARKYAHTGFEVVQTRYADVRTSTAALEKATFRAPTKQELIEFRKIIEAGDYERVKSIIWDNPRYLVSSGDTPTTLKEGYRYNAMHVCSISKKPRIAELLLQTVSDPKFVDLLTGKKNDQKMCKELCVNLLDYYLNIPEKGRSETPLHLAAKTGGYEMVEVLTSYPECKMTPNSEGLLPKDIICARVPQAAPELCKKIEALLEERFYVPVLRSMDGAIPPQIGQPFSAKKPPNLNCDPLLPEVKIQALAGPMNKEQAKKFCRRWKTPPRIGSNASTPIANNPYISPMKSRGNNNTPIKTPRSAINKSFPGSGSPTNTLQRRALFDAATPQRSPLSICERNGVATSAAVATAAANETHETESKDVDKQNGNHKTETENGLETESETSANSSEEALANEANNNNNQVQMLPTHATNKPQMSMLKTALCPQTPLLKIRKDAFFTYREQNVPSPVVFDAPYGAGDSDAANNSLIAERDLFDTPGFKERHLKITNTEKGLECIGRELAKEQNVEWREYWDFLNSFIDIASPDGLHKLENYFAQRVRDAEMSKKTEQAMAKSAVILDDVCSALEKFGFAKDAPTFGRNGFANERFRSYNSASTHAAESTAANNAAPQSTTPYTCVEKSLQVFAKRMTKTIIHNIDNVVSINDTLLSELKRLKSLICSFKEDARFLNVNFTKVHSRIGNLVSLYLENSQEVTELVKAKIQKIIQNLLLTPGERREHIECVCSRILFMLRSPTEQVLPENLKTEDMCSKVWLAEKECDCQWETNLSRKTSRRNRMEARYKTHQQAKESEKAHKQIKSLAAGHFSEFRSPTSGNDSSDELDDDVFWSDFGGSDTEEDDEVWLTPPESPSRISLMEEPEEDAYKIYVYGTEPTKRDLDVLNAIFHIDVNKLKYPNIHSWKAALLRYPNEEMDYFPSPSIVKKSQTFVRTNSAKNEVRRPTPYHQRHLQQQHTRTLTPTTAALTAATTTAAAATTQQQIQNKQQPLQPSQLPTAKRLFMSPARSSASITKHQAPITPLNKLRGLFSAYRERVDSSPMSASSASPSAFLSDGSEGSNNLSLLNISAAE